MSDGIDQATTALAVHGLAVLPSGEVYAVGIRADDILVLAQTRRMEHWQSLPNPDASRDTVVDEENGDAVVSVGRAERACRPMPVFFVHVKDILVFAHSIELMCAPCEFGMAQCHGH
eukprot:6241002-Pyramimonas_sp.AAC.1